MPLLALALAVEAQEPAGVSVSGTKSLRMDTMKEGAFINANRSYVFKGVPKTLGGLQYVLHEHKNAATVAVTVTKGGVLYLFLEASHSPESLKLDRGWKAVGRMIGTDAGAERAWAAYQRQVKAEEKLSIASPDKWGAVVAAKQVSGVPKADATRSEPAPPRPALRKSPFGPGAPEGEWAHLAGLLTSDKADPKRNAQLTREAFRPEAMLTADDRDSLDVVLRRTATLLADLRSLANAPKLSAEAEELEQLKRSCAGTALADASERKKLFAQACALRRRIAFSNPLLRFDKIVFLTHYPARYGHMCDQYFGFNARPGGGLYVLENPFGESPRVRNLLAEATVANGRLKGRKIERGSFISLDLSYDGKTILFAWTEGEAVPKPVEWRPEWDGQGWRNLASYGTQASARHWAPQSVYHIFQVNADGTDLRQLTDGPWNDFDPCFLPDGRIAFISERRGGYGRCHGRPVPTYTLHSMKPDGSDIACLSFHETNEWHPSVDGEGMIIYTRWDYVDRDSNEAHHLWVTSPDGRDPRSYHGNYPAQREARPWMEMSLRAVPGSHRIVGVAAAHHGENYGSLILIDPRGDDDRSMSQIRRLAPYCPFPEAEGKGRGPVARQFSTPWPLSEDYLLRIHDPAGQHHGLYLVDSFGNAEHLYTDLLVPCLDPIPLRARPRPPVIPSMTSQPVTPPSAAVIASEAKQSGRTGLLRHFVPRNDADRTGTVAVMNVYDSDQEWPKGTKITALRIVQIFPKTTPNADQPRLGLGSQALARGVLGTVPVEEDGSAHFEAPVGVALYFQALDERGLAVQTMRSDTYLHPGERLTCQGCHERKRNAPPVRTDSTSNVQLSSIQNPMAIRRPPSKIQPEIADAYPVLFPRLVQPVLDRHCVPCHAKHEKAPSLSGKEFGRNGWSKSFETLSRYAWAKHGGNGGCRANVTSYSVPGQVGARASKLFALLEKGHHDVRLPAEDLRRITLWLDCNSNFYGAYRDTDKQARGQVVMPELE